MSSLTEGLPDLLRHAKLSLSVRPTKCQFATARRAGAAGGDGASSLANATNFVATPQSSVANSSETRPPTAPTAATAPPSQALSISRTQASSAHSVANSSETSSPTATLSRTKLPLPSSSSPRTLLLLPTPLQVSSNADGC